MRQSLKAKLVTDLFFFFFFGWMNETNTRVMGNRCAGLILMGNPKTIG